MKYIQSRSVDDRSLKPASAPVSRKKNDRTKEVSSRATIIDNSSRQSVQYAKVSQLQGVEEEELMQGKMVAQRQSPEEEELMQGKMVAQRQSPEEEELMQGKMVAQRQSPEEEELMQGKMTQGSVQAKTSRGAGGLPENVQTKMESSMGADFSGVNIHANSSKAPEVGALAYTQGNDVHFAPGQFQPDSSAGQSLIGHELAHVVQQREGRVTPTTEVAGMPVNDNPALEQEADALGSKAARGL